MATLFNTKIKDTYQSLLKLEDNTILTTTSKNITDGLGNASPLYLSTTRVGIGTNAPTAQLTVNTTDFVVGADAGYGALYGNSNNGTFQVTSSGSTTILNLRPATGASSYNNAYWSKIQNTAGATQITMGEYQSYLSFGKTSQPQYASLFNTGNFIVGSTTDLSARLGIRGSGSTSATTSLLVQNSAGSAVLTAKDDLSLVVNDWSSQKITFTSVADNYSQIDFGNTLDTRRAYIRGGRNAQYLVIGFPDFSTQQNIQFTPSLVSIGGSATGKIPLTVRGDSVFNISGTAVISVDGATNTTNTGSKLAFYCGDSSASPLDSGGIVVFKTNIANPDNINTRMVFYNRQNTTLIERMRISDSGNLLVGTTTDTARLQVQGSGSTSATTSLLVQNSGGTTSLSVNDAGTVTTRGDIFAGTIQIGKGSSTGIYNVAIGQYVLAGIIGSSTSAYTTAIGQAAGGNIASGNHNVIIGAEVAQQSTGMSNSVLIGSKIFGGVTTAIADTLAIGTGNTSNYYPTIYATNIASDSPNVRIGNNSAVTAAVPTAPTASAILELSSTTKGFLPPRVTTIQKNAISSPAEGLFVYDTDLKRPCFFNGATWITL